VGRLVRDRERIAKRPRYWAVGRLAVALVALAALATAPGAMAAAKPNIVVIQADDQTASQFTPRVMPNTTKLLAGHGTTFRDYIVTTALCCPSRASLLTGQYAHSHGVFNNDRDTGGYGALIDKGNVLPVWLQRAGYNTLHVGKFLNNYASAVSDPAEVAPGWDEWQSMISGEGRYYDYNLSNNGRLVHKGTADDDYVTRVITHKAVQAIRQYAPSRQPFYIQIDHRAPHIARTSGPGRCGSIQNAEPDPRDMDAFGNARLPESRAFNEGDMSDKPAFLRQLPRLSYLDRHRVTAHWRCALATLVGLDRGVASVFNAVKRTGELRHTVFVYISDNGQFYGEHRLPIGKVFPYEEALDEPLVIRLPARYRDGGPRVVASGKPVANIDLAPTILDLAGGRPCPPAGACRTMDGRSLMPLLTGSGPWPAERALLTEFRDPSPGRRYATCDFAGVRTKRQIYIEHYSVVNRSTGTCESTLQVERYDLQNDPHELQNVCRGGLPASCPGTEAQARLERRLQSLRRCAGIAGRDRRVDGRPHCE
jgi:N-acetylglucosamine-6-sulfatase